MKDKIIISFIGAFIFVSVSAFAAEPALNKNNCAHAAGWLGLNWQGQTGVIFKDAQHIKIAELKSVRAKDKKALKELVKILDEMFITIFEAKRDVSKKEAHRWMYKVLRHFGAQNLAWYLDAVDLLYSFKSVRHIDVESGKIRYCDDISDFLLEEKRPKDIYPLRTLKEERIRVRHLYGDDEYKDLLGALMKLAG